VSGDEMEYFVFGVFSDGVIYMRTWVIGRSNPGVLVVVRPSMLRSLCSLGSLITREGVESAYAVSCSARHLAVLRT
jgi:hypothetical protein